MRARPEQDDVVERYIRLGLRLDRHVEGTVDAYVGPAEIAAIVAAEPLAAPEALVEEAEGLLEALDDGWLRDQVAALGTFAGVVAGRRIPYADEVERCFGVRPVFTDEEVFAAAHATLDGLLPGDGALRDRYARWQRSQRIEPGRIEGALTAAVDVARDWTRARIGLPPDEGVAIEIVSGEPWLAYCFYEGGFRSRIAVNADLPSTVPDLVRLAMHETYPGHHVERCLKEDLLVRRRGLLEESIVLVPTPQSLVAEGIATLAPEIVLGDDCGRDLEDVLARAGIRVDLAHARAVERALEPCRYVEVNAALLLHEQDMGAEDVRAYLERWGLATPELSEHVVRFLQEPTSRSYILTYPAGLGLARRFVGADLSRFRTLLTEQVRVRDLVAAAR